MNVNYTHSLYLPELTLQGEELTKNGFCANAAIKVHLDQQILWISLISDDETWHNLCHSSNPNLAADHIRGDGSLYIAGTWLQEIDVTEAAKLDIFCMPGVIRIQVLNVLH